MRNLPQKPMHRRSGFFDYCSDGKRAGEVNTGFLSPGCRFCKASKLHVTSFAKKDASLEFVCSNLSGCFLIFLSRP